MERLGRLSRPIHNAAPARLALSLTACVLVMIEKQDEARIVPSVWDLSSLYGSLKMVMFLCSDFPFHYQMSGSMKSFFEPDQAEKVSASFRHGESGSNSGSIVLRSCSIVF